MMRSILKSEDFAELVIIKEYPDGLGTTHGIIERKNTIQYATIHGTAHEVVLEGIRVVHRNQWMSKPLIIEVDHNFPFLKMQFELEGHSDFLRQNKACLNTEILNGKHQLFYFPEVKGRLYYPACHRYTLEILLEPAYLKKIFHQDLSMLGHFGRHLEQNIPTQFASECLPITPAMKQTILDFIHCPYTGMLRKVYLEAKILELLTLQIDQFQQICKGNTHSLLPKKDVEKLYFVKEWLEHNLDTILSLSQIAELAGLNEYSLKKGFKQLFNATVFGFLTDLRMQRAKALICQQTDTIAEIAFSIGYKNPQHFTVAFKRKFGYLPRELK
ncbi:MAG: AraC family transcriptional regulator [Siphonobacter sp.]